MDVPDDGPGWRIAGVDWLVGLIQRVVPMAERDIRFLIVGGMNTVFGIVFFPLLILALPALGRRYLLALLISQIVCLAFSYITNKLLVFRTRGNVMREFARFSSYYLVVYAINWGALPALVELGGIPPIIAQTGFTLVVVIGSYFWHKLVSFAAPKTAAKTPD